jgi:hypothetical protein
VPVAVEAFLPNSYLAGEYGGSSMELGQRLESGSPVELRNVSIVAVAGLLLGTSDRLVAVTLGLDELLLVAAAADADEPVVHHVYYPVQLSIGPYAVGGELGLFPGFDPGRALTRPATGFLPLRDAHVRITTPSGELDQPYGRLFVNRYSVERVTCEIDVTFWFPGAKQATEES